MRCALASAWVAPASVSVRAMWAHVLRAIVDEMLVRAEIIFALRQPQARVRDA